MITFKKIKYKNFLSSGNYWTEIELNKNGSTLVIGKNGAGKCVSINTYVTLKNKKTGEIFKMTVGEFYNSQRNNRVIKSSYKKSNNINLEQLKKEIKKIKNGRDKTLLETKVNRKFINTITLSDWEIETDSGWEEITHIHKTIPYQKWIVITETDLILECADDHIVFTENLDEIFVKNIIPNKTYIMTINGPELVVSVNYTEDYENMYDLTVNSNNHRFYTNGILSHNSTFLDSLTFALFNKPFRKINKNQLVNSINEKDCVVEVDFEASNHTWKIVRGIKPAIFKVYKDDKEESQLSSITDQQKWLEQNVLGMNFKSFIQIVVLGSSNYIPFMQLPSQHRREVVEDFLDIKVFSSMNDITKVRIKELKDEIREFQFKKENIKDKIHSQEVFINQLEERDKEDVQEKNKKIDKIANDKDHFEKENKKLLSAIEILNIQIERLSNSTSKLTKLQKIKSTLQDKSNRINSDKSFFETNVSCPTCTQSIEDEFRLKKISEIKFKDSEIQTALEDLEKTIVDEDLNYNNFLEFSNKVAKLNSDINHNNIKISQLDVQYNELQKEIKKLLSRNKDVSVEYSKLQTLKDSLEKCIEDISEKKEDLLNHEFIHLLLKDDGAKTKIIKKYLPAINYNLNKFLDLMNFTINFSLDEEFNEKSLNPIYEDFSYSSFSEGEKFRIDLAILFTWREIAKIKNSVNCNLLILDEIFDSSLDDFGTDYFSSIIKFVIKNSNIFIISHKTEELLDKFDSVIKFEKKKGFSVMLDT